MTEPEGSSTTSTTSTARTGRAPSVEPPAMRAAQALVGPAFLRRLRCEVTGADLVPRRGGLLVAANHLSFLDHFLLAAACPRPALFLGKSELAEGLGGRVNLALGMIPVERGSADRGTLARVAGLLRAGAVVAIFPEGTRSPDGRLHRFRSGLARLAADAAVPCVPVGLVGTAEVWPRGERPQLSRPAPGTLAVRFGPVVPAPEPGPPARRRFTREVQATVAALTRQELADHFAKVD